MISPSVPLVLVLLLTGGAPSLHADQPVFESAYLEDAQVCFDSPRPLDWDSLAQRHFTRFPLSHPDLAAIRAGYREGSGDSSFRYSAPLPAELTALHYYLFSERGVRRLRPTRLRGVVAYPLGDHQELLGPPSFSGRLCAPVERSTQDAGFVAVTKRPTSWHTTAMRVDNEPSGSYVRLPSGKVRVPPSEAGVSPLRAAYIATGSGLQQPYLFVRRVPDDECQSGCCTFVYDIFPATDELKRLAWTAYHCDV